MKKEELKSGDVVKMSDEFKKKMSEPGEFSSKEHIDEFGDCEGIVDGPTDWTPTGSKTKILGPEVDVRWQPSKLRYAYDPKDLVKIR
jgi:hypothetical protein